MTAVDAKDAKVAKLSYTHLCEGGAALFRREDKL